MNATDIQRVYKDTFVLFHDPLGGDRYGAVWDPALKSPRPFRVLGGFSSIPAHRVGPTQLVGQCCGSRGVSQEPGKPKEKSKDKDRSAVVLNERAVLSELERMGTGLAKRIVLQS